MKKEPLLIFSLLLVSTYHCWNLMFGYTPDLRGYRDSASKALGEVGFIMRYSLGQYPGDLLIKENEAYMDFHEVERLENINSVGMIQALKELDQKLKGIGVTPHFIVVPQKESIYRERVPFHFVYKDLVSAQPPQHNRREQENDFFAALRETGISHVPFMDLLERHKDDQLLYCPFDHHWTSFLIASLTQNILATMGHQTELEQSDEKIFCGDDSLLVKLQLPHWYRNKLPKLHFTQNAWDVTPLKNAPGENGPTRIVVAGTSYSVHQENTPYRYSEELGRALKVPVKDFSMKGGKVLGPLDVMITNGFKFSKGDFFIWEFTTQHLDQLARKRHLIDKMNFTSLIDQDKK